MNPSVRLSERARSMPASPIRRLAPLAAEAASRGVLVHPLNIGQPDIPSPPEMLRRLAGYPAANVPYGPSQGLPEFIEAVRRYHASWGVDLAPEQILATTGGSEALLFALAAVADPGDEVLVFEPFYTNYAGFARLIGLDCVPVTSRFEDGYHLPAAEAIRARITPRTRAVILGSPNNPTGTVYHAEELQALGRLCQEHDLFLIADEVYREFVYDGRRHHSALALAGLEQHVIVTDSLSKRASLCGARTGWIVSRNAPVMQAVLRFAQARLCPPTLGQYVAAALADVSPAYIAGVIEEYRARRDVVHDALAAMPGVRSRRPEGAFYLCAKLPVDDAGRFAEFLLRDFALGGETVLLAPAEGFYATPGLGRDEARLAYVIDRERLRRAMEILGAALPAYRAAAGRG